jgi:general secretion pathway protein H
MRGFTLLEVLVVMLIIGIMTTMVSLSLAPDTHRLLEDEAYRFARVLEQAAEAGSEGELLGLTLTPDGYGFHRQDERGRWLRANDDFLGPHRWPDGVHVVALHEPPSAAPWPMWRDGQSPWLQFAFDGGKQRLMVELSPLGRVSVRAMER